MQSKENKKSKEQNIKCKQQHEESETEPNGKQKALLFFGFNSALFRVCLLLLSINLFRLYGFEFDIGPKIEFASLMAVFLVLVLLL